MKKIDSFILDNGVRVIVSVDTSKNFFIADILTKIGGLTKGFKIDGKEYILPDGVAHLLEHAKIDHSLYGNMFNTLRDEYVRFNGTTNDVRTRFFINTVYDSEKYLEKLIRMVNTMSFTKEDLEETKKPVYEEIRRSNDNRFKNINNAALRCLFKNIDYVDNVGSIEGIESLDYDFVKLVHEVFYQPKNQVIVLIGNVDIEKCKKIIMDTYNELDLKPIEYELLTYDEPNEVNKNHEVIIDNDNEEFVRIAFKSRSDALSPYERVKLSFYLSHFLRYNFDDASEIFGYMDSNKYTVYSIDRSYSNFDDFLLIEVGAFTTHVEEFKERVLKIFEELPCDEEKFEIWKKQEMIEILLRDESPDNAVGPFMDNIMSYGYEDVDKISDVEDFTISDLKGLLGQLDFSNYVVVERKKETE